MKNSIQFVLSLLLWENFLFEKVDKLFFFFDCIA